MQSDPAIMPGVMQPGRLSQAQTAQTQIKFRRFNHGKENQLYLFGKYRRNIRILAIILTMTD
jgi:hypothetical protein